MISVSKRYLTWFLICAFFLPFVLSGTHWLNVHLGFYAALYPGIGYLFLFFYLEWKVSAPLFSTKTRDAHSTRSEQND